jgi:fucose permease
MKSGAVAAVMGLALVWLGFAAMEGDGACTFIIAVFGLAAGIALLVMSAGLFVGAWRESREKSESF